MASEPTDYSEESTEGSAATTGELTGAQSGPGATDTGSSDAAPDSASDAATADSVETETGAEPAPVKATARKRATKGTTARRSTRKSAAPAAEAGATDADGSREAQAADVPGTDAPAPEGTAAGSPDAAGTESSTDREDTATAPAAKRARRSRKAAVAAAQATPEEAATAQEPSPEATDVTSENDEVATQAEVGDGADEGDSTNAETTDTETIDAETLEAEDAEAEDAEAEEAEDGPEPAAPVIPTFGLLFQAPEPVAPRRRRATAAAGAPVRRVEDEAAAREDEEAEAARPALTEADESAEATTEPTSGADGADESGDGSSRRSRRRGGRGRRSRGADSAGAEESADESAQEGQEGSDSESGRDESSDTDRAREDGSDTDSGDSAEGGESSRRRRRRRRGGTDAAESDESRGARAREQVTALKGSTRLEAKKQRRREGREAGRRRQIITEAEFLARRESVERVMVVREREATTQIGVLEDGILVEHYVSRETGASMIGNVYLGRVQNVLPSMEAAFVDIGKGRNAVLYAGEVNWDAAGLEGNIPRRIENALTSGDTVLVQVTKDPIGHKGARLTSQVSLPGRFLVYVPEASMTGISRKLPDTERARLKSILKKIVPDDAGVIVRTAAEGASEEELTADIERLTRAWERIKSKAEKAGKKKGGAPVLLHGEPDLTVKVIRDVFNEDFTSLIVSGDKAYQDIADYLDEVAPDLAKRLTKWTGEKDLFTEYRVDEQIAKALDRKVWLPSGGSLVIDRTEAMTVIDVNTGKFVGSGGNLEETVTKNNIEAAEEIVRQLRLRDIGGIIVIDFIDMVLESNRDLVVRRLLECLGRDRTKHQVAEVTSLGLVQMTRKRVGTGLLEVFSEPCAHCGGRGVIVHSDPLDQPSGEDNGSGRSRGRGRGNGGGRESRERQPVVKPATNGPTAAQIAAAAHAAALKAAAASSAPEGDAEADSGAPTVADAGTPETPEASLIEATETALEAGEETGSVVDAAEPGPEDTAEPRVEAESEQSPEAVEGDEPATAGEAESASEPATAGAGASEVASVPQESPDEVASVPTQAPDEVAASLEAPEIAPLDTPEPRPRQRRKRGRVIAPAGPPGASEVRILTPED